MMEWSLIKISNTHQELLFLLLLVFHGVSLSQSLQNPHNVSAFSALGDSSADTGNNNYIPTTFKSNIPPYGRDFIDHIPTGRFTNVSYLGLKETIPPYLDFTLSDEELLTGVNFASAGSGFDPLTAKIGGVIPVWKQVDYMEECISRIGNTIGKATAASLIQESGVLVSAGANDFILNYFVLPVRNLSLTVEEYQDFVLDQLSENLQVSRIQQEAAVEQVYLRQVLSAIHSLLLALMHHHTSFGIRFILPKRFIVY